eukprot:g15616.t1
MTKPQVDDVVLHRDIDGSNLQFQEFAELMAGAAGRRCVGAQDRVEGKRHKEAVTSLVQEVFSPESPPLQAQRPARRRIPVAAASLVDDVVLDRDIDGSRQRFLDYAELTAGAAGRPCVGTQERQDGRVPRKHLPVGAASGFAVPSADDAVSSFVALTAGAAGRRYAGAAARAEGRRCFQKASMMKEIFSEALSAPEMFGGCCCADSQDALEAQFNLPIADEKTVPYIATEKRVGGAQERVSRRAVSRLRCTVPLYCCPLDSCGQRVW